MRGFCLIVAFLLSSFAVNAQFITQNNNFVLKSDQDIFIKKTDTIIADTIIIETQHENGKVIIEGTLISNDITIRTNNYSQSGSLLSNNKGKVTILADDILFLEKASINYPSGSVYIGTSNIDKKGKAAHNVSIRPNVIIDVSASNKNMSAGKIIIWSLNKTSVFGNIKASSRYGKGGFVEVSSKKDWVFPEWAALVDVTGEISNGEFLIDPNDIVIGSTGPNITIPVTNSNFVSTANVNSWLNSGNHLIIQTTGGGGSGDITLDYGEALSWTTNAMLILVADRDIILKKNSSITNTAGGHISLKADRSILIDTATISANYGIIEMLANDGQVNTSETFIGININHSSVTTEWGDINLEGYGGRGNEYNDGVLIWSSFIKQTSTVANSGTILIKGYAGESTDTKTSAGVYYGRSNPTISTVNADIILRGYGTAGTATTSGVVSSYGTIKSTGTGVSAGNITIIAESDMVQGNGFSIYDGTIKSVDGDIRIDTRSYASGNYSSMRSFYDLDIFSTGSGNIDLNIDKNGGTTGHAFRIKGNSNIYTKSGTLDIRARGNSSGVKGINVQSNYLKIGKGSTTGNITIEASDVVFTNSSEIRSTGNLYLKTVGVNSMSLGSTAGLCQWSAAEIDNIYDGFNLIQVASGTSNLYIGDVSFKDNTEFRASNNTVNGPPIIAGNLELYNTTKFDGAKTLTATTATVRGALSNIGTTGFSLNCSGLLTLLSSSATTLDIEDVNNYDKYKASSIDNQSATLSLTGTYTKSAGDQILLMEQTGGAASISTFTGYNDNTWLNIGASTSYLDYDGYTGNDILLSTTAAPGGIADGLTLWFKADEGVSLSGSNVTQWNDFSGNNYHAPQSSSTNRPNLINNDINYNPTISFNGTSDRLPISTLNYNSVGAIDKMLVFCVFKTAYSGSSYNSNWAFLDFDRSDYFNLYLDATTNSLGFSTVNSSGSINDNTGSITGLNDDKPHIAIAYYDKSVLNHTYIGVDRNQDLLANNEASNTALGSGSTRYALIGDGSEASSFNGAGNNIYYDGEIAELIYYDGSISDALGRNQINTYLAIKYGITLNSHYYAADGAIVWDKTNNSAYHNDIISLAKDDNSYLNQTTSISQDESLMISNLSELNDNEFVVIGNNGLEYGVEDNIDIPLTEGIEERVKKVWKVSITGNPGTLDLSFDDSSWSLAPGYNINDIRLLVDTDFDGSFADETVAGGGIIGGAIGGRVAFQNVTLADGQLFTVATVNATNSPLPIELISFDAQSYQSKVLLNWVTASEINNDYFNIERSKNGYDWEIIKQVDAAGNSSEQLNYQIFDFKPYSEVSYYRLKQTDFDGLFSYSDIKVVNFKKNNEFILYPNPSKNTITIKSSNTLNKDYQIFNVLGQDLTLTTSKYTEECSNCIRINISALPIGLYIVKMGNTLHRFYKK